jgi:cytochrome P450
MTVGPLAKAMAGLLLNTDGEPHARVRRLVSQAFRL